MSRLLILILIIVITHQLRADFFNSVFDRKVGIYKSLKTNFNFLYLIDTNNSQILYNLNNKNILLIFYRNSYKYTFDYSLKSRGLFLNTVIKEPYILNFLSASKKNFDSIALQDQMKCELEANKKNNTLDDVIVINALTSLGANLCPASDYEMLKKWLKTVYLNRNSMYNLLNEIGYAEKALSYKTKIESIYYGRSDIKIKCDNKCNESNTTVTNKIDLITLCKSDYNNLTSFWIVMNHEFLHSKKIEFNDKQILEIEQRSPIRHFSTSVSNQASAKEFVHKKPVAQKISVPEKLKYIEADLPSREQLAKNLDLPIGTQPYVSEEKQIEIAKQEAAPFVEVAKHIAQEAFPKAEAQEFLDELEPISPSQKSSGGGLMQALSNQVVNPFLNQVTNPASNTKVNPRINTQNNNFQETQSRNPSNRTIKITNNFDNNDNANSQNATLDSSKSFGKNLDNQQLGSKYSALQNNDQVEYGEAAYGELEILGEVTELPANNGFNGRALSSDKNRSDTQIKSDTRSTLTASNKNNDSKKSIASDQSDNEQQSTLTQPKSGSRNTNSQANSTGSSMGGGGGNVADASGGGGAMGEGSSLQHQPQLQQPPSQVRSLASKNTNTTTTPTTTNSTRSSSGKIGTIVTSDELLPTELYFYNSVIKYKPISFFNLYQSNTKFKSDIQANVDKLNIKIIDLDRDIRIVPKESSNVKYTIQVKDNQYYITK